MLRQSRNRLQLRESSISRGRDARIRGSQLGPRIKRRLSASERDSGRISSHAISLGWRRVSFPDIRDYPEICQIFRRSGRSLGKRDLPNSRYSSKCHGEILVISIGIYFSVIDREIKNNQFKQKIIFQMHVLIQLVTTVTYDCKYKYTKKYNKKRCHRPLNFIFIHQAWKFSTLSNYW